MRKISKLYIDNHLEPIHGFDLGDDFILFNGSPLDYKNLFDLRKWIDDHEIQAKVSGATLIFAVVGVIKESYEKFISEYKKMKPFKSYESSEMVFTSGRIPETIHLFIVYFIDTKILVFLFYDREFKELNYVKLSLS